MLSTAAAADLRQSGHVGNSFSSKWEHPKWLCLPFEAKIFFAQIHTCRHATCMESEGKSASLLSSPAGAAADWWPSRHAQVGTTCVARRACSIGILSACLSRWIFTSAPGIRAVPQLLFPTFHFGLPRGLEQVSAQGNQPPLGSSRPWGNLNQTLAWTVQTSERRASTSGTREAENSWKYTVT